MPDTSEAVKTLDFTKVEALRSHMLLNSTQMATVLGVSRVTYSKWLKGSPIRKSNDTKAREGLRKLFTILHVHQWPQREVVGMSPDQRFKTLLEFMAEDE